MCFSISIPLFVVINVTKSLESHQAQGMGNTTRVMCVYKKSFPVQRAQLHMQMQYILRLHSVIT